MTYHLIQDTNDAERLRFAQRMNGAVVVTNDCRRSFVFHNPRERTIKPSGAPLPERGDNLFRELETMSKDIEQLESGHHANASGVQLRPIATRESPLDQLAHRRRRLKASANYPVGPIVKTGNVFL